MRKIKAFGCMVLVIALVTGFALVSVPEVASAYIATEEDVEYLEWIGNPIDTLTLYSVLLMSAVERSDYDSMELWNGKIYDCCEEALNEIDQFDVSPEMQPIKDEYKMHLQDRKQSAYYLKRWIKYHDTDDFDTAISYGESAGEHLKKCNDLLDKLKKEISEEIKEILEETPTPSPTPQVEKDSDSDGVPDKYDYAPNDPNVQTKEDIKTPGFGPIFAIGSILAVAYLVMRRRRK